MCVVVVDEIMIEKCVEEGAYIGHDYSIIKERKTFYSLIKGKNLLNPWLTSLSQRMRERRIFENQSKN